MTAIEEKEAVEWPRSRRETGLIERTCPHGVGHPDPESVFMLDAHGPAGSRGTWGIHGCDGCCFGKGPDDRGE